MLQGKKYYSGVVNILVVVCFLTLYTDLNRFTKICHAGKCVHGEKLLWNQFCLWFFCPVKILILQQTASLLLTSLTIHKLLSLWSSGQSDRQWYLPVSSFWLATGALAGSLLSVYAPLFSQTVVKCSLCNFNKAALTPVSFCSRKEHQPTKETKTCIRDEDCVLPWLLKLAFLFSFIYILV